jgi:hypothetical protein
VQFENEAQRQCYERVKGYMRQMFGEQVAVDPDTPQLRLGMGSALIGVMVGARDDHAVVSVISYPITEVEPSLELYQYLLHQNSQMYYAAFGIDDANDITLGHDLYGDTLDKEELEWALAAVAGVSDQYDDEIKQRWGGKRAIERG